MSLKKGPWKQVSTKDIYHNPWMKVQEDKVVTPDGKNGIFGIVTLKQGVSTLPLDNQNNVYLVEQYRYTMNKKTIEVVCGGIEKNESPITAAKRELEEEVGIKAGEWISLGKVDPYTSIVHSSNHLFLAKDLSFFKPTPEGTEKLKILKIPFSKAVSWVMTGKITHSPTVSLILKVSHMTVT